MQWMDGKFARTLKLIYRKGLLHLEVKIDNDKLGTPFCHFQKCPNSQTTCRPHCYILLIVQECVKGFQHHNECLTCT